MVSKDKCTDYMILDQATDVVLKTIKELKKPRLMKKLFTLLSITLLTLTSCTKPTMEDEGNAIQENSIVGTWVVNGYPNEIIKFNSDGSGYEEHDYPNDYGKFNFIYSVTGSTIRFVGTTWTVTGYGETESGVDNEVLIANFVLAGNTLHFTETLGYETVTLTRR